MRCVDCSRNMNAEQQIDTSNHFNAFNVFNFNASRSPLVHAPPLPRPTARSSPSQVQSNLVKPGQPKKIVKTSDSKNISVCMLISYILQEIFQWLDRANCARLLLEQRHFAVRPSISKLRCANPRSGPEKLLSLRNRMAKMHAYLISNI